MNALSTDRADRIAAPSRTLLTTFAAWRSGIATIIALARQRIAVFDADGTLLDLDRAERIEALRTFLAGDREARLSITLRSLGHVSHQCARFGQLVGVHGHQIELREAIDDAARVSDCFVIADDLHFARRAVHAQPRGVLVRDDPGETRAMLDRHAQVITASVPVSIATTLGL